MNAVHCDNFNKNREFLRCLKYVVLELSEKSAPSGVKPSDEQIARNTSKSVKLLGCDLQRNQPTEWNDFMVACIGSD